MRKTSITLRFLCTLIDLIILMLPVQILLLGVLKADLTQVNSLFLLLTAVYSTICCEITGGMTVGKYFGKMCVLDKDGVKPPIMYLGLRELTKSMYLQYLIGPILLIISLILYLIKGTTLHDLIGHTRVVYRKQAQKIKEEQNESK